MQTGQLILILLAILVVAVVVVVLLRRRAAKREQQRVEAAALRTDAETIAARVTGLSTYAEQAAERAEVARLEAEEKAREAARLEDEAATQRAAAEETRREYEATMRRADDLDPDVKESSFSPVDEREPVDEHESVHGGQSVDEDEPVDAARRDEAVDAAPVAAAEARDDAHVGPAPSAEDGTMTRAERREAREHGDADGPVGTPDHGASGAAAPAAVGAAAAGATAWAARDDTGRDPESERIASAADFRDDVAQDRSTDEVYPAAREGNGVGMSDQSNTEPTHSATDPVHDDDLSRDTESPRGEWGGPPEDGSADAGADSGADVGAGASRAERVAEGSDDNADLAIVGAPEDYAATEPVMSGDQTPPVEREPVEVAEAREHDATTDESVRTDEASDDPSSRHDAGDEVAGGQTVVVGDTDAYASTEPLLSGESTPGDASDGTADHLDNDPHHATAHDAGADADSGADSGADDRAGSHAPAETGAAVAEPGEGDGGSTAHEPTEERFDPTPTRDWAADEGELLDENQERADRLADERAELGERSDTGTASGLVGDTGSTVGDTQVAGGGASRRISDFHELRDGGYGVGSAAPLDDRAQPLDHPVQGFRESMTFRSPGDADYDSSEPDVWFYDVDAAERSGFRRAHG